MSPQRALREALAARPAAEHLAWLTAHLRDATAQAWRVAESLIATRPALLRDAATALLDDPASGQEAVLTLARLHARLQDWPALRDHLLRFRSAPEAGRTARLRALLRCETLAPTLPEAEIAAIAAEARLDALGRASLAVQRAVAAGLAPDPAPLHAALAAAASQDLPAALLPVAAARDVAIVGNGACLLGRGEGALIEAHEVVLRLNYPVLTGFEADAGRRTDLVLFAGPRRANLPALLAREPDYARLPALAVGGTDRLPPEAPPSLPRGWTVPPRSLAYDNPTTGFFAILLVALLLRRRVSLFGFDFFDPGRPGHYFGGATAAMEHDLAYERWFAARILPLIAPATRVHGG